MVSAALFIEIFPLPFGQLAAVSSIRMPPAPEELDTDAVRAGPRLLKALRELADESQRREAAEKREVALRNVLTRLKRQRTGDAPTRRIRGRRADSIVP